MKADSNPTPALHAMLDGSLDPDGEQAVLDLLARDPEARREFARLSQIHLWLATDDSLHRVMTAPPVSRFRITRPAWWLAAAIAAALFVLAATRLWPAPGGSDSLAFRQRIEPLFTAACAHCHERLDALLGGVGEESLALHIPGQPARSVLWERLSGNNPCAQSLDPAGKSLILQWLTAS